MYRYSRLFAVCCKDRASRCEVESLPFQPWDRFPHIFPYMAVSFNTYKFIYIFSRFASFYLAVSCSFPIIFFNAHLALSLSLFLSLYLCISLFLSLYLSFSLFLSLPYLSIYIFIYRSIFIYVQIFFFIFSLLQGSQGLQFSIRNLTVLATGSIPTYVSFIYCNLFINIHAFFLSSQQSYPFFIHQFQYTQILCDYLSLSHTHTLSHSLTLSLIHFVSLSLSL